MKKVLVAGMLVFGATLGFANTSLMSKSVNTVGDAKVDAFGTCTYTIVTTTYWSDGTTSQSSQTYELWAYSYTNCQQLAQAHVDRLNNGTN